MPYAKSGCTVHKCKFGTSGLLPPMETKTAFKFACPGDDRLFFLTVQRVKRTLLVLSHQKPASFPRGQKVERNASPFLPYLPFLSFIVYRWFPHCWQWNMPKL